MLTKLYNILLRIACHISYNRHHYIVSSIAEDKLCNRLIDCRRGAHLTAIGHESVGGLKYVKHGQCNARPRNTLIPSCTVPLACVTSTDIGQY